MGHQKALHHWKKTWKSMDKTVAIKFRNPKVQRPTITTTPRSRMSTGPPRPSTSWSNDGRYGSPVRSHPPKMSYESYWTFLDAGYIACVRKYECTLYTIYRIHIHISESGVQSAPKFPFVMLPLLGCGWNKRKGKKETYLIRVKFYVVQSFSTAQLAWL